MTPRLSPRTKRLVQHCFHPKDISTALLWLEQECGNNLPFCDNLDEYKLERMRFAAIKLSHGTIDKLVAAIDVAKSDWRDLLMASDFGYHLEAYELWANDVLGES